MPRFSANLGFLWPDRPLLERIEAAGRAGVKAVEVHWPYEIPAETVAGACRRAGVKLLGMNTEPGDAAGEFGMGTQAGREDAFLASSSRPSAMLGRRGHGLFTCWRASSNPMPRP